MEAYNVYYFFCLFVFISTELMMLKSFRESYFEPLMCFLQLKKNDEPDFVVITVTL